MKEVERIKIVVYDDATGKKMQEVVTDKALLLFDMTSSTNIMNIKNISIGKPEFIVSLLNFAIHLLTEQFGLRAYLQGESPVPFFNFKEGSNETV